MEDLAKFAVFLILTFLGTVSSTMQCYKCSFFELESDSSIVNGLFSVANLASDDKCQLLQDSDIYDVQVRNCPPPDEDEVTKCINIAGEVETKVDFGIAGDFNVKYRTVERDCINVPKSNSPETSDGCHDSLSYKEAKDMATSFLESWNIVGDTEWDGAVCYGGEFYTTSGAVTLKPILFATSIWLILNLL